MCPNLTKVESPVQRRQEASPLAVLATPGLDGAARADFPEPLGRVGNAIVWQWEAISRWARSNMNFEILPDGSSLVVRELRARGQWIASRYLTGLRGYRTFNLRDEGAPALATPEVALDWTKRHIAQRRMDD